MEAAVTDLGSYTPYPPEEWAPSPRSRATAQRSPASPAGGPPAPPAGGPGQRSRTATQTDDWEINEAQVVELRNQVADRLRLMNARHGRRAWELASTDPIAPHGLAFFYADRDPQPTSGYQWRIRTATRLFLDGPETVHLPRLLWEQTRIADGYRRAGTLDPRTQLANRVEPMTAHARYYGVGVSTVDLPNFPWARQRQSQNGYDIIGACFALLADGTWLLLHRGLPGQFSAFRIWSSQSLDTGPAMSLPRWNWGRHLPKLNDPGTRDIWVQLQAIHDVLTVRSSSGTDHPRGAGHGR